MWTNIRNVTLSKMRILKMFITAVCVVFINQVTMAEKQKFIIIVVCGLKIFEIQYIANSKMEVKGAVSRVAHA